MTSRQTTTNGVSTASEARQALRAVADAKRAVDSQRFFKSGPGEYAEGDQFIGAPVPETRKLVKSFATMPIKELRTLLTSPIHEERLLGLLILVHAYQRGDNALREKIYGLYTRHFKWINNWDLVDVTAQHVVGAHLFARDRAPLFAWVQSDYLWTRRIAIMSTFHFIRRDDFTDTLRLAEHLLHDSHDLIHKAVGWMLREVGNRDRAVEEAFLQRHYRSMPRTMLRYAIEKFPEPLRQAYLKGQR